MKKIVKMITATLIVIVVIAVVLAFKVRAEFEKAKSDDPLIWESVIADFEKKDLKNFPPQNAVLFVGSSSIRFWRHLKEDMHPFTVINRGFGGAKIRSVIHYADRIIFPYQPKAVVIFAGTNDIAGNPNDKTPEQTAEDYKELSLLIEKNLPQTEIFYLPISPTTKRWHIWPKAHKANYLVREFIETRSQQHYIDVTPQFFKPGLQLKKDLIWWDGIHLSRKGYRVWAKTVKDSLVNVLEKDQELSSMR